MFSAIITIGIASLIGLITKRLLIFSFHSIDDSKFQLKRPWRNQILTIDNATIKEMKRFLAKGEIQSYSIETERGIFELPLDIDPYLVEKIARKNNISYSEIDLIEGGVTMLNKKSESN